MTWFEVVRRSWQVDRARTLVALSLVVAQNVLFVVASLGLRAVVDLAAEGRAAAASVDAYLMGSSALPSPVRATSAPLAVRARG